jgi:hypothetical protein
LSIGKNASHSERSKASDRALDLRAQPGVSGQVEAGLASTSKKAAPNEFSSALQNIAPAC